MKIYTSQGYRITSPFGKRIDPFTRKPVFHNGIDLVKAHKSPIHAFYGGTVIWARMGVTGSGYGGYGNVVAIRDRKNHTHVYAHLDSIDVQQGQQVSAGQVVGRQGTTGRSTGSHLHYEIRRAGWNTHIDPTPYLRKLLEEDKKEMDKLTQPKPQPLSLWAKEAHAWVVAKKISDGSRPKDVVTREEMWVMLHRASK